MIIKTLTLWDPWGTLIANNLKEYETCSWADRHRGLLAIHVAKRWTEQERRYSQQLATRFPQVRRALYPEGYPSPRLYDPPLGKVVCICDLDAIYPTNRAIQYVGLLEQAVGDWSPGRYAWHMKPVLVLKKPVTARGRQGLWDWKAPKVVVSQLVEMGYATDV